MFYLYFIVCFAVGLGSRSIRREWTLAMSLGAIALGIALNSWRWIDWGRDGLLAPLGRMATEGVFWYLLPSALIFAAAFVVGRLTSVAFLKKTSK